MGSAVSAVMKPISSAVGGIATPISGVLGNAAASAIVPAAAGIYQAVQQSGIGKVQQANQIPLQNQINATSSLAHSDQNQGQSLLNQAGNQLNSTQGAINQSQNSLNTGQGAVNLAQQTALGGNEANALSLLQAQANGTAPSAAQAQLTAANNQAIAQQHALANSGNLSQMIGGQKSAMENAAQLAQSNANAATQLRATQQQTGQQNYASAAGQQAGQVAQNAGLQQQQTAQQQQQAAQQAGIYGTQLNTGTTLTGQSAGLQGTAQTGQLNAAQLQQQALTATGQNQATAAGGLVSGLTSAATGAIGGAAGAAKGGVVPGYSKGGSVDKESDDTTQMMLSPGEVIIPKSALVSKEKAIKFLEKVMEGLGPKPRELSREELLKLKKKKD